MGLIAYKRYVFSNYIVNVYDHNVANFYSKSNSKSVFFLDVANKSRNTQILVTFISRVGSVQLSGVFFYTRKKLQVREIKLSQPAFFLHCLHLMDNLLFETLFQFRFWVQQSFKLDRVRFHTFFFLFSMQIQLRTFSLFQNFLRFISLKDLNKTRTRFKLSK